jgi:hypothetical protein
VSPCPRVVPLGATRALGGPRPPPHEWPPAARKSGARPRLPPLLLLSPLASRLAAPPFPMATIVVSGQRRSDPPLGWPDLHLRGPGGTRHAAWLPAVRGPDSGSRAASRCPPSSPVVCPHADSSDGGGGAQPAAAGRPPWLGSVRSALGRRSYSPRGRNATGWAVGPAGCARSRPWGGRVCAFVAGPAPCGLGVRVLWRLLLQRWLARVLSSGESTVPWWHGRPWSLHRGGALGGGRAVAPRQRLSGVV